MKYIQTQNHEGQKDLAKIGIFLFLEHIQIVFFVKKYEDKGMRRINSNHNSNVHLQEV